MKTSRLKKTVIVLLALVNICLLVLLVTRKAQERSARARTQSELSRLFAASGVELPATLIPHEEVRLSAVNPARDTDSEAAFADAVLGPCTPEDVGGGIYRYVGGAGQCLLRASGAVEASLERPVDDPEAFYESFFSSCGYASLFSDIMNGSGSAVGVRMLASTMVFNAELTLRFSDYRLVAVEGSFVPPVESGERGDDLDGVTALVRFLDYANANGEVCTAVSDVRGGYLLQSTASASQRLIPVWRITTDVSRYYVNMSTGEVTREA